MPRTILPNFAYVIEHTTYSTSRASLVKNTCPCVALGILSSFKGPYSCRAMDKGIYSRRTPHVMESCKGVKSDQSEEPNLNEKIHVDSQCQESVDIEDDKEIQRRVKIGHRNKGKVPWNKGRKHSEETRERIRRRTKEALKDPKVRKKMSEAPRVLSDQTKVKICASLTSLWEKRLKWKRSREKFLQSWAESITKAAKLGGSDQQELDWDSYDKLKREIALQQIHQTAEKAKAKEMARIQAQRAAEAKAEKMARLAEKRREREENAKARGASIRKRNKKSKEEKERLAEFQEEKLKERLMKIEDENRWRGRKGQRLAVYLKRFNLELKYRVRGKRIAKMSKQLVAVKEKEDVAPGRSWLKNQAEWTNDDEKKIQHWTM
ncbi:hypothetical protein DH2020_033796 [Rehmannia glutinosa]|uniref:Nuclease associated modular domain-containing protein n=1 Tax=Rehmannia glutinosa TaxID=99300 RepID=A0ABR0VDT7_REHGL